MGSVTGPGACTACEQTVFEPLFVAEDWYLRRVGGTSAYHYLRCIECGTVVSFPPPDAETLAQAYVDDYRPLGAKRSLVERAAEPIARREAKRITRRARPDGDLLDIGCGSGTFMMRLRRAGYVGEMRGIEPDEGAARRASVALGCKVRVDHADNLGCEAPVDVVVLRHVIEHVRDPLQLLVAVRKLLRPDGILYLGTPDARALAAEFFGKYWHGYDPPRHLFAFTSGGMRQMLARAGFLLEHEYWDFAPQMWTGSLQHALIGLRVNESLATMGGSNFNPVAAVPAILAASVEKVVHRSTMYAVVARVSSGPQGA